MEPRLARARTFDQVAELYDRARPACPAAIFDALFEYAGARPSGVDVLEIGCGTGQATLPLARLGCRIVAVEMGARLAAVARRNLESFPRVEIVNSRFEDYVPSRQFDIVFAASAWHWLDPESRYAKAAGTLRAGGTLAFTTGGHAFPPGFDSFFAEIQPAYEAIGVARMKWPPPEPDEVPDSCDEVERSGHFENVRAFRHLWDREFTADEYIDLVSAFSDHLLFEPASRERLFAGMRRLIEARPGGRVRKHYLTILNLARRKV